MIVHNGGNPAITRLKALGRRVHIAALAPHVASSSRHLDASIEWAMAVLPFEPKVRRLGGMQGGK
jgi:hypothetical protein